ncbi:MAG: GntR family transcriptional regulator [Lachnospiraceae bacterium]|nr:GntR family transcriptional regulator [Lachnospiraceae bacterium]
MLIRIDFGSEEALYMQLYNQIICGIANADLRQGDTLPSVRELAEDIGINMHTVNKAYAVLRQEGYVRLDRRRGAVIDVNSDKLRAMEALKNEMRISLAKALCRGLSEEEIHAATDEVLRQFQGL